MGGGINVLICSITGISCILNILDVNEAHLNHNTPNKKTYSSIATVNKGSDPKKPTFIWGGGTKYERFFHSKWAFVTF